MNSFEPNITKLNSVLFVCTGNICRSPMAEGIMREYAKQNQLAMNIDSAGTHGYHIGESYDSRTLRQLAKHGIDLSSYKSRQITRRDFADFDLILYADKFNLRCLQKDFAELVNQSQQVLPMTFCSNKFNNKEIPDPYYMQEKDFELVYDMLFESLHSLIETYHGQSK